MRKKVQQVILIVEKKHQEATSFIRIFDTKPWIFHIFQGDAGKMPWSGIPVHPGQNESCGRRATPARLVSFFGNNKGFRVLIRSMIREVAAENGSYPFLKTRDAGLNRIDPDIVSLIGARCARTYIPEKRYAVLQARHV